MKHWADHKKCSNQQITCPLCRCDWGVMAIHNINDDKKESKIKNKSNSMIHYGFQCASCKFNNISGERYRCISCNNYNLCRKCYSINMHSEH